MKHEIPEKSVGVAVEVVQKYAPAIIRSAVHPYTDALEAFNRATHEDALLEMQIAPAENLQADERPTPRSVLSSIPAREIVAAFAIAGAFYFIAAAVSVVVR